MNPKTTASLAAGAALGLVGLATIQYKLDSTNARTRRDLQMDSDEPDYDVQVDDWADNDFVDEWSESNPNSTDLWKEFNRNLGIELTEDDVIPKQKRVNWNRLKDNQIKKLHPKMLEEYQTHMEALAFYNEISGTVIGKRDPSEFGSEMNDEGDYSGYGRTAPVINGFLDAFGCKADGSSNFRQGKTNFWFLFPNSVPLFSGEDDHLSDWTFYWQFLMKFTKNWPGNARDYRFSLGTYGTTASFTPRGFKFRSNTPWARMQRYYKKPRMNAARPKIFASLRSALTYIPRYGISTATKGDNCVMIWFFQDVPRDLNDFMVPEQFGMIDELHSMCTLVPVIVGPQANGPEWQNFVANMMPGLVKRFAKDPDFNGAFHVESFAGLVAEDFHAHLNNYLCLVENRATCRIYNDAWIEPRNDEPTADPTEGFRGIEDDYDSTDAPEQTEAPEATTAGSTVEPTTQKIPEIDSCCGHNGPAATAYDSELKTCCENGNVKAYEYEGEDPCMSDSFDF